MRPREPVFIEILNGLSSWWSNWLKMRNWYVISSLPLHFILHSWYPMVGINHLTLPLKFGVLRQNIHEDIQQAILAARFLSKNSLKKRTTCLFPTLPSTFFTYFGYHLKGIDELITYMPSKVKGQSYLLRKWVVHLHYLFLLRLSVLKLDPKKRSTSTFTFLNPSLCGLLWWGKPIDKFLINLQSLSQQKWNDFTQPMLRYRHIRSECAHSGGLSKNSSQKAEYIHFHFSASIPHTADHAK